MNRADLPDGVVGTVWDAISPDIDHALERVRTADAFRTEAGSALAGDDAAIRPSSYSVTAAAMSCLGSGMDHLHALKSHVNDGPMLHISSPFSLARGALENLSIAYWILHPAERADRVERTLRWYAQNCLDAERALRPQGVDCGAEQDLLKLEGVARRITGVAADMVRRGHSSTAAVKYTDQHVTEARTVLYAWQLCSGFAHGRGWAIHGTSNAETFSVAGQDKRFVRITANDTAVLWATLTSLSLAEDTIRTFDQQAGIASEQVQPRRVPSAKVAHRPCGEPT